MGSPSIAVAASAGARLIADFCLRGSRPCRHRGVDLSDGGWTSKVYMISTTPTLFSQRAEPSPLWSKASSKRRTPPVAVASGAIEVSGMGEGEGSAGVMGRPGGNSPAVGGSKGRSPSPAPTYYVG